MIVAAAWIIPAILGAVDSFGQWAVWGGRLDWGQVLFTAFDWLLYGAFTPIIFRLSARWPLTRRTIRRSLWRHVLMSLAFCVVWATSGTILRVLINPHFQPGLPRWYAGWVLGTLPFGASVYLAMVGIEHAVRYFSEARERETQLARMSEQLAGAKLSALQAQLNPHFLFNSLNTVAVLVRDKDTARATSVIEQLSDVLRRTLSRTRGNEVSLDDEVELVREYLGVEQARFADRLRARIDVDESLLSAAVPSFALQHLVENAIRHGISRRTGAGLVAITARRVVDSLELVVRDDGGGLAGDVSAAGHGLDNTRQRLRTLYGGRASLRVEASSPHGVVATLVIPHRELLLDRASDG